MKNETIDVEHFLWNEGYTETMVAATVDGKIHMTYHLRPETLATILKEMGENKDLAAAIKVAADVISREHLDGDAELKELRAEVSKRDRMIVDVKKEKAEVARLRQEMGKEVQHG